MCINSKYIKCKKKKKKWDINKIMFYKRIIWANIWVFKNSSQTSIKNSANIQPQFLSLQGYVNKWDSFNHLNLSWICKKQAINWYNRIKTQHSFGTGFKRNHFHCGFAWRFGRCLSWQRRGTSEDLWSAVPSSSSLPPDCTASRWTALYSYCYLTCLWGNWNLLNFATSDEFLNGCGCYCKRNDDHHDY